MAAALALISSSQDSRANVYATDINLNGSISNLVTGLPTPAKPVSISYHINDPSATNVVVTILNGNSTVATISGGYAFGLNTVLWGGTNNAGAPVSAGAIYSVKITAKAAGYPFWTQISVDANPGNYVYYAHGIDVDKNTNSPYYGRVVTGSSYEGTGPSGAYYMDGIYKANADGTVADEGGFGYGGYSEDDGFDTATLPGEMPSSSFVVPYKLRIGGDDRIYMLDYSYFGSVSSFDMTVSSFTPVIDEGVVGYISTLAPNNNYSTCDDYSDLGAGAGEFDVSVDANGNGAIYLCNNDYPNWGIWMFHLTNGVSDPSDTEGTQAVYAGTGSTMDLVSSGGCMVDTNLDIFCSQDRNGAAPSDANTMVFSNWNAGILPADDSGFDNPELTASWSYAPLATNYSVYEAIRDTVIDSRTTPKYVALPQTIGNDTGGGGNGITVLNAIDGSFVSVTNGATIQTLTNFDHGNQYNCAAFDAVGNLYGSSISLALWRAWSPPGANTNTTVAFASVVIPIIDITKTTIATSAGCSTVTITFSAAPALPVTGFTLVGSSSVSGRYAPVSGATITLVSPGVYQATATVCSGTQFFAVSY